MVFHCFEKGVDQLPLLFQKEELMIGFLENWVWRFDFMQASAYAKSA